MSLCGAFPALFDLVDETDTGEAHDIGPNSFGKVADQCYLCDLCYMTKCPYVPSHPWNVDFPHLMLRVKAAGHKRNAVRLCDKVMPNTDALGYFAGIPIVTRAVNAANRTSTVRGGPDATLGVDRRIAAGIRAT
ncbi:hypothetical protein WS68_04400 [Burkholderia sp. TSV86]|nr:hypothetical protein WS68_04400 [Burkholderia sp. TSV86]